MISNPLFDAISPDRAASIAQNQWVSVANISPGINPPGFGPAAPHGRWQTRPGRSPGLPHWRPGGPAHGPGHRSRGCPRGRDRAHHGPTWGGRAATLAAIDCPPGPQHGPQYLERLEADRLRNCEVLLDINAPLPTLQIGVPRLGVPHALGNGRLRQASRFAFLADQRHETFVLPGVNGSHLCKLRRVMTISKVLIMPKCHRPPRDIPSENLIFESAEICQSWLCCIPANEANEQR